MSDPLLFIDAPVQNATLGIPFTVSGWAIDRAASSGTGVDTVRAWAYPEGGGKPILLGDATLGGERHGVARFYGEQFRFSGYRLSASTPLAGGGYTLKVSARSSVTGIFEVVRTVSVVIGTDPRMQVDRPLPGVTVSLPFTVSGWAIDRAASSGTGVDAVRVWAYPQSGGTPTFLGIATLGGNRPGVEGLYGAQFNPSHFTLRATTPLAPGVYTFRVSAHSTVTHTWNDRNVQVTVKAATQMRVDSPTDHAVLTPPFVVSGWAINTGATSGVGVDAVHVWAHPQSGGSPTFLGEATLGIGRPGVAALHGEQFRFSGYRLQATKPLAEGSYVLKVHARNTITNSFSDVRLVRVRIAPDPMMWVDSPRPGTTVSLPFQVTGWAIDRAASSGSGVDAVHVWAFRSGASPVFLGKAKLGSIRPGVGALYGAQFSASGFGLLVTTPLAPGNYTLTVFARSSVTNTFNNSVPINTTVSH